MIRTLQWKFTAIITITSAILLSLTFVILYSSTKSNYYRRSLEALRDEMEDTPPPERSRREGSLQREGLPVLVLDVMPDGDLFLVKNHISDLEDSAFAGLIACANGGEGEPGILPELRLRYLYEVQQGDITRYVFADITQEYHALRWQLLHSVLIGLTALIVFFFLARRLSRWALRPAERAWESQRQFIADASHELKTPLTVILANVHLLMADQDILPGKNRLRLENIQAEAGRMKRLTEGLLTLARKEAKSNSAAKEPVDLSYLAALCVATFEPVAFDMGKGIDGELEKNVVVYGDKEELRQLIEILLDNACKYSREGSRIRVRLSAENPRGVILAVSNEGEPLSKEEISRIFRRFYRAESARSLADGSGLGLSIAQSIADEHRAQLKAEAADDGKITFSVCFRTRT